MSKRPFVRSAYNYDAEAVSLDTGTSFEGQESLTVQSEKDNSDINVIVKRFSKTGLAPQSIRTPMYGDFVGVHDFRTAMDAVLAAKESFDALPSEVRARFNNDPQGFLEFCAKKENLDEMRRMGLAVPVVPPATPPTSGPEVPPPAK